MVRHLTLDAEKAEAGNGLHHREAKVSKIRKNPYRLIQVKLYILGVVGNIGALNKFDLNTNNR
jgi:hypothetical protein